MTVWNAAKSYKESDFKLWMKQVKDQDPRAYSYLMNEDPKSWSRSKFPHFTHSEHVTNNFSESFNNWIIKLRDKPILLLVERYPLMMMTMFYKRRTSARQWDDVALVPTAQKRLTKLQSTLGNFIVRPSDDFNYEVESFYGGKWVVNVQSKNCSCVSWQLRGVPCVHAVAILSSRRPNWLEYCSEDYYVATYRTAYALSILPSADQSDWGEPNSQVKPPIVYTTPGRPKMRRRKDPDENPSSSTNKRKCTLCGIVGHNSRTCSGKSRKRPRTRGGLARSRTSQGGQEESSTGTGSGNRGRDVTTSRLGKRTRPHTSKSASMATEGSVSGTETRGGLGRKSGARGGGRPVNVQQSISQTMSGGRVHQTFYQSVNFDGVPSHFGGIPRWQGSSSRTPHQQEQ